MEIIHATAKRVWARFQKEKKTQEDLALAIGISQQSVSNLIKGSYRPGLQPARQIALLDGKKLEDLVGEFATVAAAGPDGNYANLDVCIQFHGASKHWSPWTIAAARHGYFGLADFAPPEWAAKLDMLETALQKARKTN